MASERPSTASLAEVVDRILDKGIVIDIWARVSVVGIEILTVEARVVAASVDTFLHGQVASGDNLFGKRCVTNAKERPHNLASLLYRFDDTLYRRSRQCKRYVL